MVEVTGLDRPGLLYELTTTLSKLNLNIASAHVATFGERVVDVFYVTDLTGAQIATPNAARPRSSGRCWRCSRRRRARASPRKRPRSNSALPAQRGEVKIAPVTAP